MTNETSDGDSVIGKVEEKIGWLTGDREVEAKGKLKRLDAADGEEADGDDEAAADAVAEAEKDNRANYGEYDASVDGEAPAKDVRPVDRTDD